MSNYHELLHSLFRLMLNKLYQFHQLLLSIYQIMYIPSDLTFIFNFVNQISWLIYLEKHDLYFSAIQNMNMLLLLHSLTYLELLLFLSSIIFLLLQMLLVHLLLQKQLYIKFLGHLLYEYFFQLQLGLDNHIIFLKSSMDPITQLNHIFHSLQTIYVK